LTKGVNTIRVKAIQIVPEKTLKIEGFVTGVGVLSAMHQPSIPNFYHYAFIPPHRESRTMLDNIPLFAQPQLFWLP